MRASAPAKINLALVVGSPRADGKHELLTIYQRLSLADRLDVAPAPVTQVDGFAGDTIVAAALRELARRADHHGGWRVRIEKRIPVAAGLGGGSSDAAAALRLANASLPEPLPERTLHELAAEVGADVPFFLGEGPQLGSGDGTVLEPLDLPQDFWVLVLLPAGAAKSSTASVYAAFDERDGAAGWDERAAAFREALARVRRPRDLAALPPNDLATSPLAERLGELGAFRADVTGAGPALFGLFHHKTQADAAARALRRAGRSWVTAPAWYG